MKNANLTIGQEVVRSKGDYVVGRIGLVVAIDAEKNRAQVEWNGNTKTWVSFNAIELTSNPYEIVTEKGKWPKYIPNPLQQHKTEKVMYNGVEVESINFGTL
jgi:hypothetical protein